MFPKNRYTKQNWENFYLKITLTCFFFNNAKKFCIFLPKKNGGSWLFKTLLIFLE